MLIFEKGKEGRGLSLIPECDVEVILPGEKDKRQLDLHMPELSENEISRHYTELAKKCHGVNDGFYPLGSCTMKYTVVAVRQTAQPSSGTPSHSMHRQSSSSGRSAACAAGWRYR